MRDSLDLFNVSQQKFKTIRLFHISEEEINQIDKERKISERIKQSKTINGTRSFHSFSSISGNLKQLNVKTLSNDTNAKTKRVQE